MEQTELSFATKVKIISWMSLAALLFMVVVGGVVMYQRNAKAQAAQLAKTQLANVEAIKTAFPDYKNTEEFKESAKMAIVKVRQEDLPTTTTAGLDDSVSPNPVCNALPPFDPTSPGSWSISKVGGSVVADSSNKNGWDFSAGGNVSIPAGAEYGKYTVGYFSEEACSNEYVEDGHLTYHYVFKITPPCPTGVTLTVTATPQ